MHGLVSETSICYWQGQPENYFKGNTKTTQQGNATTSSKQEDSGDPSNESGRQSNRHDPARSYTEPPTVIKAGGTCQHSLDVATLCTRLRPLEWGHLSIQSSLGPLESSITKVQRTVRRPYKQDLIRTQMIAVSNPQKRHGSQVSPTSRQKRIVIN